MAEEIYGNFRIGGELPREALPDLQKLIDDSFNDLQIEGDFGAPETSCEIRGITNGITKEIRKFCRDNKLSYEISFGSCGEYDAEEIYWDPSLKDERVNITNQDGWPVMKISDVRTLIEELRNKALAGDLDWDLEKCLPINKPIPPLKLI
jgi:hypothetical protein